MSQHQQPTQGVHAQQMGQQMGQQTGQPGRLSSEQRVALNAVAQAIEVCEWCADQCVQEANPNMIECIRLCEDVADLGEATLSLLPRNSRYGENIVRTFEQAVQTCAQECGRHSQPHCQECSRTLQQTLNSIQPLLQPTGQQMAM